MTDFLRGISNRLRSKTSAALSAAGAWQIASYVIPLLTTPYLARILGPHQFGQVAVGLAVATYVQIVTDWGFNFTATQAAARLRADPSGLDKLISATIFAKASLFAGASIVTLAVIFTIGSEALRPLIILSLIGPLGGVFNLDWLLRGTERIGTFAITTVFGRLCAVPLVFLLVRDPGDVNLAAFALAISSPITAAVILYAARRENLLHLTRISVKSAFDQISVGAHVFLSTAAISIYTNTLSIVIAGTSNATQVGLFSSADKIRRPVQSLYSPIAMVFYPRLSYLAQEDASQAKAMCSRILLIQGSVALTLSIILAVTAPLCVTVVLGNAYADAVPVLRVLSSLIFMVGLSNVLGLMIMIPFGLRREFLFCVAAGAVIGLGLAIPLSMAAGALGAAVAAASAEATVTVSMYVVLSRRFAWFRPFGGN